MRTLPQAIADTIVAFRDLFSKRVYEHVKVLVTGAILAPGRRTVCSILRVMGKADDPHFQNYHRVLSRAAWSPIRAARVLLEALIDAFVPEGPVLLGIDDTIERRRGAKIAAKGIYRDPVRSSHSHFVKASGLRWISVMLLAHIPWAKRVWALPVLTVLSPSERYYLTRKRRHVPMLERAGAALRLIRRWLPTRVLVVVADTSFAAIEWLAAMRTQATIITRLRLDAALYEPAPVRTPGQKGRPRIKGAALPKLEAQLLNRRLRWKRVKVADWYGEGEREVEIRTGTGLWYHGGKPAVPIRWVLIRDPLNRFKPQALLCTDVSVEAVQILQWFVRRCQLETTFEEVRAHMGVETQRQWTAKAIARTTPALMGLFSLVALCAKQMLGALPLPARQAAWYDKHTATFSDTLALVREALWTHERFSMSGSGVDIEKVPRAFLERLTHALCFAA